MLTQRIQQVTDAATKINPKIRPLIQQTSAFFSNFELYKKNIDIAGDKIINHQLRGTLTLEISNVELQRVADEVLRLSDEGTSLRSSFNDVMKAIKDIEKEMKEINKSSPRSVAILSEQIEGATILTNKQIARDDILYANKIVSFGVDSYGEMDAAKTHINRVLESINRIANDYKNAINGLTEELSKKSNVPPLTSDLPSAPPADTSHPSAPPLVAANGNAFFASYQQAPAPAPAPSPAVVKQSCCVIL